MKKIIASVIALAVVVVLVCVFARPGFGDSNDFLSDARLDEAGELYMYIYDGYTIQTSFLGGPEVRDAMLNEFTAYSPKKADNWSQEMVTLPVYAFATKNRPSDNYVAGFWSNGYWVTPGGEAYVLDCDIDELVSFFPAVSKYGYKVSPISGFIGGSDISLLDFPCARLFSQNGDSWVKEMLNPSEDEDYIGENANQNPISAEITSCSDDKITIKVTNNADSLITTGGFRNISVLLDGDWYAVPPMPGNQVKTPSEHLEGKESMEITFDLSLYGDLPPGEYRAESGYQWSVPFTVE